MQTTVTLNINGQPVHISGGHDSAHAQASAALGSLSNMPHLNNLHQLTNILDSINPYLNMAANQSSHHVDPS